MHVKYKFTGIFLSQVFFADIGFCSLCSSDTYYLSLEEAQNEFPQALEFLGAEKFRELMNLSGFFSRQEFIRIMAAGVARENSYSEFEKGDSKTLRVKFAEYFHTEVRRRSRLRIGQLHIDILYYAYKRALNSNSIKSGLIDPDLLANQIKKNVISYLKLVESGGYQALESSDLGHERLLVNGLQKDWPQNFAGPKVAERFQMYIFRGHEESPIVTPPMADFVGRRIKQVGMDNLEEFAIVEFKTGPYKIEGAFETAINQLKSTWLYGFSELESELLPSVHLAIVIERHKIPKNYRVENGIIHQSNESGLWLPVHIAGNPIRVLVIEKDSNYNVARLRELFAPLNP